MKKFEVYVLTLEGTLEATGIWDRGRKLSHVEDNLSRTIKKLKKPCVIVISELSQENSQN